MWFDVKSRNSTGVVSYTCNYRYDYLAFNDAKGTQMKFDQKVGSSKWPKQVNFSGPHLHFLFHSDSSNTEWGYKFKVRSRSSCIQYWTCKSYDLIYFHDWKSFLIFILTCTLHVYKKIFATILFFPLFAPPPFIISSIFGLVQEGEKYWWVK